ncbi:hypothetical protein [Hymenobacter metallilatus]|uniref:Uncharacterized protein n=1 Tax=Hymenobacter metallilatus TaxID=2493666 RepID=A0A428IXY4_9BACT|nr:hypothetical protein [Hymenobacter metallilatus]RSK23953.1 hypothetical protein EI290_21435 [Hymenobacter metallilatus]
MSKINHLETVYGHLSIRANYFVNRLLRLDQYEFTPEIFDHYTKSVGQATIMQAEIDDHCDSLEHIAQACKHGLEGTEPEHYREFGYEFTEEMEAPELPYDPYADILGYLAGGANISCMTLSPALLRFIELLPEVAADRAERDVEAKDGILLYLNDDGSSRPMTRSELLRKGNRTVMEAAEQSLFATTYAEDMLRVQELARTRGSLQEMLKLLDR